MRRATFKKSGGGVDFFASMSVRACVGNIDTHYKSKLVPDSWHNLRLNVKKLALGFYDAGSNLFSSVGFSSTNFQ